jgi:C1A family cysteine protease
MAEEKKDEEKKDAAELQAEIDKLDGGWQAGESSISKLSTKDQDILLGYTPGPEEESLEEKEEIAAANLQAFEAEGFMAYGYPSSFDLRNVGGKNYITPVKNQGGCGSCVAFGTAATVEGTYKKILNRPNENPNLSEAHLFYCVAKSQGRNCGNGWWVPPAMTACRDIGVVDEKCFPYTAGDQACKLCSDWKNRVMKITKWHDIRTTSDMKTWLSTKGPLAACYTVYSDFFQYRSGIYRHISGAKRGGHCVCCVGYNDSQKYWIMKNSWGSGWGENGYFRIAYGQCGIDAIMWAADGIVDTGWCKNVLIRGLWTIDQVRNAWVYVGGHGWKKVSNDNDTIFYTMLTQLTTAKAGGRRVNLYIVNGMIRQVYVL